MRNFLQARLHLAEKYAYIPLPDQDHIRLATIYPGEYNDEIVISLHASPFHEKSPPIYEALSYAWGSGKGTKQILVDPESSDPRNRSLTRLKISNNLTVALRHLRHRDDPRIVWIDAICINQQDNVEKGPQVSKMGEIFRLATRVIAWLGPEENHSSRAMDVMEDIGSQIQVDFTFQSIQPTEKCRDPSLADQFQFLPLDAKDTEAIRHLLGRQWYERLWIRQEIYLANPQAVVACGHRTVNWVKFRSALYILMRKPVPWSKGSNDLVLRLSFLRGFIIQFLPVDLQELRTSFLDCECSDARDRIYAVIALLGSHQKSLIPAPDYEKSYIQVYREVTLEYCLFYRNVNILRSCEFRQGAIGPSWVPDWSKPISRPLPAATLYACGPFGRELVTPRDGVLGLMGVSRGCIEAYQDIPNYLDFTMGPAIQETRTLILGHDLSGEYVTGISKMEAYVRTLLCDSVDDTTQDPTSTPMITLAGAKDCVNKILSGEQFVEDEYTGGSNLQKFMEQLGSSISQRRLVKSTNGYIGLAPPSTEAGDEICVLLGCIAPMVLRPVGNGEYIVVGECFILGLSRGEALLGPLPRNIRPVFEYQEEGGYQHGFIDDSSGRTFYRDPRLDSLQLDVDVHVENHDDGFFRQGGLIYADQDALRRHGVDLKWFYLV